MLIGNDIRVYLRRKRIWQEFVEVLGLQADIQVGLQDLLQGNTQIRVQQGIQSNHLHQEILVKQVLQVKMS